METRSGLLAIIARRGRREAKNRRIRIPEARAAYKLIGGLLAGLLTMLALRPNDVGIRRALIDDLREGCRRLPVEPTAGRTPNEADWATAMNRLRHLALHADPRAFLRWDVIVERMAVRGALVEAGKNPIHSVEAAVIEA